MTDDDIPETFTYPTDPVTEPREGVIENRTYGSTAATNLIRSAREGDVLDVKTWGSTTPDPTVTVTGFEMGEAVAVDDNGNRYRLWPRYYVPGGGPLGSPWLRSEPGNDSRGEIHKIVVVEKGGPT